MILVASFTLVTQCLLPRARAKHVSKRLVSSLSFKARSITADRNSGLESSDGNTLFKLVML